MNRREFSSSTASVLALSALGLPLVMPTTAQAQQQFKEAKQILGDQLSTEQKTADAEVIAAVQRLHAKGLITQIDGGYLTSLGRDAAEHAQTTLGLLTEGVAAAVGK